MNASYHDLHVTTADIPRTSIFNLPYGLEVICNRVTGYRLYRMGEHRGEEILIAGEFDGPDHWLVLDVAGCVITDTYGCAGSLTAKAQEDGASPG